MLAANFKMRIKIFRIYFSQDWKLNQDGTQAWTLWCQCDDDTNNGMYTEFKVLLWLETFKKNFVLTGENEPFHANEENKKFQSVRFNGMNLPPEGLLSNRWTSKFKLRFTVLRCWPKYFKMRIKMFRMQVQSVVKWVWTVITRNFHKHRHWEMQYFLNASKWKVHACRFQGVNCINWQLTSSCNACTISEQTKGHPHACQPFKFLEGFGKQAVGTRFGTEKSLWAHTFCCKSVESSTWTWVNTFEWPHMKRGSWWPWCEMASKRFSEQTSRSLFWSRRNWASSFALIELKSKMLTSTAWRWNWLWTMKFWQTSGGSWTWKHQKWTTLYKNSKTSIWFSGTKLWRQRMKANGAFTPSLAISSSETIPTTQCSWQPGMELWSRISWISTALFRAQPSHISPFQGFPNTPKGDTFTKLLRGGGWNHTPRNRWSWSVAQTASWNACRYLISNIIHWNLLHWRASHVLRCCPKYCRMRMELFRIHAIALDQKLFNTFFKLTPSYFIAMYFFGNATDICIQWKVSCI